MSEKTHGPSEFQKFQPIERVELEKVNGLRRRLKELLKQAAVIGGISLASGGAVGTVSQSKYRDWMGYHPDQTEMAKPDAPKEAPKVQEEKEAEGYLEKAKKSLAAAKKIVGEKISDLTESSETVQQYRQTRKELAEIKKKFLEVGDKTAFWLPFILTFLASTLLANKIVQVKKLLSERVDPVVERNMTVIESKLNELVDRVNAMQSKPSASIETQARLASELNRLSNDFLAKEYEFEGNPKDR
ncbi:hypothetical protein HZA44_02755 [Candidatus Peregrinibacteria bacterium]|nr:hypothetical protein [Candidatus Peregrinibacteria bacterium]